MTVRSFALASATALLVSGLAVAQVPEDTDRDPMQRDNAMQDRSASTESMATDSEKFSRLDLDGDGRISAEEARQGGVDRFEKYDGDSDGYISKVEFAKKKSEKHDRSRY